MEVLLVEDSADDAELTIRALSQRNLANRLTWIRNGAQALDFLFRRGECAGHHHTPKLVLLDLHLPKVNGIEVLTQIKMDPRTRAIPVVILSSSTEGDDVSEIYRLGANGYVTKPVSFDEYVSVVGEVGLYWLRSNRRPE